MNHAFEDLIGRYPSMLAAWEALPEYDRKAICDGLRECVVSRMEDERMTMMRLAGVFEIEKGDSAS